MRFGFFFHEAVRALTRNAVPSFAAMATVLVTVLVLGVFIPVVQATTWSRTSSPPTSRACAGSSRTRRRT
jgi:cell division protein FtsX